MNTGVIIISKGKVSFDDLFLTKEEQEIYDLKELSKQFIRPTEEIVADIYKEMVECKSKFLRLKEQYIYFKSMKIIKPKAPR